MMVDMAFLLSAFCQHTLALNERNPAMWKLIISLFGRIYGSARRVGHLRGGGAAGLMTALMIST
ncbi:hypothetical protein, partial [Serratia marcescens]|uniref:hypothetical protein n=1 Tax=Serratia marcescens TaxID=615 RepID=UPI00198219F4